MRRGAVVRITQGGVEICPHCGNRGWRIYNENHGKPCEACCTHPGGWWVLTEHHGASDERYAACRDPGCRTTITRAEYEESAAPAR